MRRLLGFSGLLAVSVLVSAASPVSAASSAVTVASGSFTFHGPEFGLPYGENRTEAFAVQQSADGTVRGQVELRGFSGGQFHGDVNCFTREGNQAIVGGTITQFTDNPSFVNSPFAFAIQDNPDVSTFLFFGFDLPGANPCEDIVPAAGEPDLASFLADFGFPITTGNIMIHPAS